MGNTVGFRYAEKKVRSAWYGALMVAALFPAGNAYADAASLSLKGAHETLVENFKQAPVWRSGATDTSSPAKPLTDPSFSWAAGYIWNHALVGAPQMPVKGQKFPAWTSNNTADADPNGDMIALMGPEHAPLKWTGMLEMRADTMPDELVAGIKDNPTGYVSAAITSFPYSQQYGVFAMVAKLPSGKGIWPAFWLLPATKAWPPEIDVMEVLGSDPSTLHTTIHLKGAKGHESRGHDTQAQVDLSAGFHEYAVDWGPQTITWYLDRKQVFSTPTPDSFQQPFYILANLAVGKTDSWGGAPDEATKLPAVMQVKSIRAWQRPEYETAN